MQLVKKKKKKLSFIFGVSSIVEPKSFSWYSELNQLNQIGVNLAPLHKNKHCTQILNKGNVTI